MSPIISVYLILCACILRVQSNVADVYDWVTVEPFDSLPNGALEVGGEIYGRKLNSIYLVRRNTNSENFIGFMQDPDVTKKWQANILVGQKESVVKDSAVQVLVATRSGLNKLRWAPYTGGLIPPNAISAGQSSSKEERYICRGIYKGNIDGCKIIVPGELMQSTGFCHTYYKEPAFHVDYQVLTVQ